MSDSAGVAAESEAANLQAVRVGALFWKEHEQTAAVVANAVPEIFSFYNSQGVQIYGMVYRPPNFHPGRKYPVLLRVYGGPNVQMITNDYKYPKFLRVFLALSFGYVVVMIDSQGSYDRGVRFEGAIKGRLGAVELNDQVEGLLYLATRDEPSGGGGGGFDVGASSGLGGFIDPTNVCITGWSYGGYLSLMGLANFPHVFRVAIAGAPVTSWELYDSAYTERYLGLIEENADGYRRGSVLDVIQKFPDHENRLLIVHGSIDENVHFKNTELVVSALIRAAKPHRVQVYPGERHGLRAADVVEHFETLMMWTLLNAPPLLPP
ncbi:Alpha/Beta hydrolase protein [Zopfochytrium polystomum]|nr:Alpha/Beta hydrolase protein [Zopfochytrium polystomum]